MEPSQKTALPASPLCQDSVVKGNIMLHRDEEGITTMGLKQFMPDPDSLDL